MRRLLLAFTLLVALAATGQIYLSPLTVAELNVENLFDTEHDSLKNDYDFLPNSDYHWTHYRYWEKQNKIAQEIISCGEDSASWTLPDIVGLCEVENDTVLRDLTARSLLRKARYQYVMTDSPDERGVDVALLYSPFSFFLLSHNSLRVQPLPNMRPTRDILYVSGRVMSGDTLHIFVLHAPSRRGGEIETRAHRRQVATRLCDAIDSIRIVSPDALILAMGDFNDYHDGPSLQQVYSHRMVNVSKDAKGRNGAKGTYRFRGEWGSLDQMVASETLAKKIRNCRINDAKFLLEEDTKYGGVMPKRFFLGPRCHHGYSDHLPLVMTMDL